MDYKTQNKDRYLILKGLYDRGALVGAAGYQPGEIGASVALSAEESISAAAQLERAGLLECTEDGSLVRLSAEGLRTIERVLRQPLPANDAYPDVTDFDDQMRGTRSVEAVDAFLAYVRQVLPKLKLEEHERIELRARVEDLEGELRHPCVSRSLTLAGLSAIRDILQHAAEGDGIAIVAQATELIDTEARP